MTKNEQTKLLQYLYQLKSFGYKYHDLIQNKSIVSDENIFDVNMIEHCLLCDASKHTKNKVVDYGDSNSQLVVLTPIAIYEENEKLLLKNIIEKVLFLNFESIYMLNIVKCAILKKDFNNTYMKKCAPYTITQLQKLENVKVILSFGNCYEYLMGQTIDMEKLLYKVVDYGDKKLLLLPSLDFIIKNPSVKKSIFESLQRIQIFLENK